MERERERERVCVNVSKVDSLDMQKLIVAANYAGDIQTPTWSAGPSGSRVWSPYNSVPKPDWTKHWFMMDDSKPDAT